MNDHFDQASWSVVGNDATVSMILANLQLLSMKKTLPIVLCSICKRLEEHGGDMKSTYLAHRRHSKQFCILHCPCN